MKYSIGQIVLYRGGFFKVSHHIGEMILESGDTDQIWELQSKAGDKEWRVLVPESKLTPVSDPIICNLVNQAFNRLYNISNQQ